MSARIAAVLVGLVYTAVLYVSGVTLDSGVKQSLALLPAVATAAIVAYDLWLWKWPVLRGLHSRPRIGGLWKATLQPRPESHIPEGGNRGPISAYVVIEQTFWTLSVQLFTPESASASRASRFTAKPESKYQSLSFVYENVPRPEHRARSPRHVGACELTVANSTPTRMAGEYFTDRFTAGEMRLELCDRSTGHGDYAAAQEQCSR